MGVYLYLFILHILNSGTNTFYWTKNITNLSYIHTKKTITHTKYTARAISVTNELPSLF